MKTTHLILVGGFLGAGKTTLLSQAAKRLGQRGLRVGLVTNDQAANLVDTSVLREAGAAVEEVPGGCFCCRFDDLVGVMESLCQREHPDVLLGEPVGSCTDLSATVLQPLKAQYRDRFRVAPLSVLVDVRQVRTLDRLRRAMAEKAPSRLPPSVLYIYEKQLEEADLIVLNKADMLAPDELATLEQSLKQAFPRAPVLTISALGGQGIDKWLDFVTQALPAGRWIAEVDYDRYAEGEAALGWLNAAVRLVAEPAWPADWASFCRDLLETLRRAFIAQGGQIAHVKLHLQTAAGSLAANVTANDGPVQVRGAIPHGPSQAVLLLNARARIDPEPLRRLVIAGLGQSAAGRVRFVVDDLQSFSPARPQPRHRFAEPVP